MIITPDYYNRFKCIADKCKHNCCIGWEIDIDDITLDRYSSFTGEFASRLKNNIEFCETPHFILDKNERCPFLNKKGLCDIITNLGEDMLCQICSDHPRFRNFYDGYEEVGLGLYCEAAAEIILKNNKKVALNITGEALQIPVISFREKLFNILQDRTVTLEKRIDIMLDTVDAHLPSDTDWYLVFYKLERMDNEWDKYLLRIKNGIEATTDNTLDTAYEQLIIYLIFRHFADGQYDGNFKARILFAVLTYKVIKAMNTTNTIQELIEIARIFSCEIEYSEDNISKLLLELN